jgi:hypothetical protein
MRKCGNCRSLLLGDVQSCPRCGAPVPVALGVGPGASASVAAAPGPATSAPPAARSASTSAAPTVPSYGRLSIPSPVPSAPVGATSGPEAPGAPPLLREAWQPVAIETPAAAATRYKPWARVALAVAVLLVVGAAAMHLRSDPLPAGTSAFVSGQGITYTSPDGTFQVQLPQQPQVERRTIPVNGVNSTLYIALVQSAAYEAGVASVVFPAAFDRSRINDALDEMTSQGVKTANGTSVHKTLTTHGAQPALEAKFTAGDGYSGRMLVIASGSSLIMVIVHAKTGTERLYRALEESLLIH